MASPTEWHPVLAAHDLHAGRNIVAARVAGEEVALWRSAQGVAQAWHDRCPHRGVRLSLGRVIGGRLSCAYHGWEYAADTGRCERIPALADLATVPGQVCATTYAAAETQGMVWVRLESTSTSTSTSASASAPAPLSPGESGTPAAGNYLRSLALRAPLPQVHSALTRHGFWPDAQGGWQGQLAQWPLQVFTLEAQPDLSLVHWWLRDPAPDAGLRAAFAAIRRFRSIVEAGPGGLALQ